MDTYSLLSGCLIPSQYLKGDQFMSYEVSCPQLSLRSTEHWQLEVPFQRVRTWMLWLTLFSFVHTQSKGSALDSEAGRQLTFRPRWFLSLPPAGKQLPLVLSCFWASGSPWLTPPSIADLVSPWNPSVELRGLCGTFPCYLVTPWMWTVLPLFFF